MSQEYFSSRHLGQKFTPTVYLNVVSNKNTKDIMNYGLKDLSQNIHTDVTLITEKGDKIGFHAFVLTSASPVIKSLIATTFPFREKQIIHIADTCVNSLQYLRSLLYGYSVNMTNHQIDQLMSLNQMLEVQLKLSVSPSSTEMDVSQQLVRLSNKEDQSIQSTQHSRPTHPSENHFRGMGTRTILGQIEITRNHESFSSAPAPPNVVPPEVPLAEASAVPEDTAPTFRSEQTTGTSLIKSYQGQYLHQIQDIRHFIPYQHESPREYVPQKNNSPPEVVKKRKRKYTKKTPRLIEKGVNGNNDTIRWQKFKFLGNEPGEYSNQQNNMNESSEYFNQQNNMNESSEYFNQQNNLTTNSNLYSNELCSTLDSRIKQPGEYPLSRNEFVDQAVDASYEVADTDVVNDYNSANNTETSDHHQPSNSKTDKNKLLCCDESTIQDKEIENIQLPESFQQEETVNTLGSNSEEKEDLPLLCWFCSQEFQSFQSLCDHINSHSGSNKFSRRHHRCPRCGEVLHSTWKLRQHLITHHTEKKKMAEKSDHQYAERPSRSTNSKKPKGDHGYATLNTDALNIDKVPTKEEKESQTKARENKDGNSENDNKKSKKVDVCSAEDVHRIIEETPCKSNGLITQTSDLRVQVSHEHSYGTKRDSSPEQDHCLGEDLDKIDHAYSTAHPAINANHPFPILVIGDINNPDLQPEVQDEALRLRKRRNLRRSKLKKGSIFSCTKCSKSFPQRYRLTRHIREVHDKEKEYKCDSCTAQFFKSSSLIRHKVSVHLDYRPYTCSHCKSSFKDEKALRYHMEKNVCDSNNYSLNLQNST